MSAGFTTSSTPSDVRFNSSPELPLVSAPPTIVLAQDTNSSSLMTLSVSLSLLWYASFETVKVWLKSESHRWEWRSSWATHIFEGQRHGCLNKWRTQSSSVHENYIYLAHYIFCRDFTHTSGSNRQSGSSPLRVQVVRKSKGIHKMVSRFLTWNEQFGKEYL
jgi:hypothetical protein